MKILCFSDLHLISSDTPAWHAKMAWLKDSFQRCQPDLVAIAGDVFESSEALNPRKVLSEIFPLVPVVAVLGNHEMFFRSVHETLDAYSKTFEGCNVHYLDVECGFFDFEKDGVAVRLIGNFLGYDGSMRAIPGQRIELWADGSWADRLISGWDKAWLAHCEACKAMILEAAANAPRGSRKILLTHTVPHTRLNGHPVFSKYNAYSGVAHFLEDHAGLFDYAVCGHTHLRSAGIEIADCKCFNVGNDYYPPFQFVCINIEA